MGLLVAGAHSGCGKTWITLAVAAALCGRGARVQTFKCGPDFLDPLHHEALTGRSAHNLPGWICDRDELRRIFARHAAGATHVVVEGAMGLFDGALGRGPAGSTAEIAMLLGLPVLLVVDATSMAGSAAALVHGFSSFDPRVRVRGAAFTRVASPRHRLHLETAMRERFPDMPCFFVPRLGEAMPSRHLGLVAEAGAWWTEERRGELARTARAHLPPEMLAACMEGVSSGTDLNSCTHAAEEADGARGEHGGNVRVAVARDEAFCFMYRENLRHLRQAGAEIVFFSPLRDTRLPENVDGVYLGGGYPELHAEALCANKGLRRALRAFAASGGTVYAECGGLMYAADELVTENGCFPMAGLLRGRCVMESRFQALGYREVTTTRTGMFGPAGTTLRGHEFHYSRYEGPDPDLTGQSASAQAGYYRVGGPGMETGRAEGYGRGRVLASYIHLHFGSCPEAAGAFVEWCRRRGAA